MWLRPSCSKNQGILILYKPQPTQTDSFINGREKFLRGPKPHAINRHQFVSNVRRHVARPPLHCPAITTCWRPSARRSSGHGRTLRLRTRALLRRKRADSPSIPPTRRVTNRGPFTRHVECPDYTAKNRLRERNMNHNWTPPKMERAAFLVVDLQPTARGPEPRRTPAAKQFGHVTAGVFLTQERMVDDAEI